jgi:putative ABC transport system ATP-binding protein
VSGANAANCWQGLKPLPENHPNRCHRPPSETGHQRPLGDKARGSLFANALTTNILKPGIAIAPGWAPTHSFFLMIELNGIFKYYDNKFQRNYVLRDINLTIGQGEFVTLMGPSGVGKSSLLNIIGLLDAPDEGEYKLLGEPVQKLKEKRKADIHKSHIGFVFQAYHLIDELTVYENIETPLLYRDIKSAERQSMVAEVLDRFQMVAKKDLFPHQLSGGQQQLVGVARAIIGRPKLLLADEPTGNLHSKQGQEIMELFQKLNSEGMTIIQVTHSEANAQYGQRLIELLDGRVQRDVAIG